MNAPLPPVTNRMAPDRAPTPFSAAEIAEGCQPGRVSVYRITEQDAPSIDLQWEFTVADDAHAEYQTGPVGDSGTPLMPPATARVLWTELQAHASYPEDQTSIEVETIEIPAGTFRCWKYTVDDGRIVSTAWFALDLPGPPARKIDTVDGVEVSSMTLLGYVDPRV